MTLPRSPRPNYTQTLPSFFLRLSFVLHGPYYYKAVALIPPRPCAIHSPLVRLLVALPTPFAAFFFSSLFVSLHARPFFVGSPASTLKSKLPDRGHYRVSIVRRSVSNWLPRHPCRFVSLFLPSYRPSARLFLRPGTSRPASRSSLSKPDLPTRHLRYTGFRPLTTVFDIRSFEGYRTFWIGISRIFELIPPRGSV